MSIARILIGVATVAAVGYGAKKLKDVLKEKPENDKKPMGILEGPIVSFDNRDTVIDVKNVG